MLKAIDRKSEKNSYALEVHEKMLILMMTIENNNL